MLRKKMNANITYQTKGNSDNAIHKCNDKKKKKLLFMKQNQNFNI